MGRQAIRTLTSPTAVTIHSVFDSEGRRIAEYDEASGALLREYVWNGWDPIAVIEGGTISFVRADHIGRPVFATNSAGTKVWSATYNPFGGVHTSTGSLPNNRFPGQWFQTESGLHQNWMRDYDPTTGRYLQADPLGLVDGASVYGYVKGNPARWVDPRGLTSVGKAVPTEAAVNDLWCAGNVEELCEYVWDEEKYIVDRGKRFPIGRVCHYYCNSDGTKIQRWSNGTGSCPMLAKRKGGYPLPIPERTPFSVPSVPPFIGPFVPSPLRRGMGGGGGKPFVFKPGPYDY